MLNVFCALPTLLASAWMLAAPPVEFDGIVIDGEFDDWEGIDPHFTQSIGSPPGDAIAFENLWVHSDAENIYLRFDTHREMLLPNTTRALIGNEMRLVIDGDNNSSTGISINGQGAELVVRFGERQVQLRPPGSNFTHTPTFAQAGIEVGPTHSSTEFEVRIPRTMPAQYGGGQWQQGDTIRLVLFDAMDGRRMPNSGAVSVTLSDDPPPEIPKQGLLRAHGTGLRLLNHNTENAGPVTAREDIYARLYSTLEPDVITWQEMWPADVTFAEARTFLETSYPSHTGNWYLGRSGGTMTASVWPIQSVETLFRTVVAHIDTPPEVSVHGVVLFNTHTPCCDGGNDGRDSLHDEMSALWRDLLNGNGPFTIHPDTPVIMTGDFNMVGFKRQLLTIRDGQIIDNAANGPDFNPGRGEGSLRTLSSRHSHTNSGFTWRRHVSSFAPGRLDWVFYSGDVAEILRGYVLSTDEMPQEILDKYGLQRADTSEASDHLPIVADFRFANRQ